MFSIEEKSALIAIYTPNIGSMRWSQMLLRLGNEEKVLSATENELVEVLGKKLTSDFLNTKNSLNFEKLASDFDSSGITFLSQKNPKYPLSFTELVDAPIGVFIKGEINLLSNQFSKIAIVGTRKPSSYGQMVTHSLSSFIAKTGAVIVSGMAVGIDTIAHSEAIKSKSSTIAVLGCGVNVVYPSQNQNLYKEIISGGGCVISEFAPDMTVQKGLFVTRNRLISALSTKVVIVEGAITSGSMITAKYAAEQGKEVFALPGPINQIHSQGPNYLIKTGATPLTTIEDVFDGDIVSRKPELDLSNYPEEVLGIIECLKKEPFTIDGLSFVLHLQTSDLMQKLSILEIDGVIEKGTNSKYYLL